MDKIQPATLDAVANVLKNKSLTSHGVLTQLSEILEGKNRVDPHRQFMQHLGMATLVFMLVGCPLLLWCYVSLVATEDEREELDEQLWFRVMVRLGRALRRPFRRQKQRPTRSKEREERETLLDGVELQNAGENVRKRAPRSRSES